MHSIPFNFQIESDGEISQLFRKRAITDFPGAAAFIRTLPYGRNADKTNLSTVFSDNCGTCSTKHAVLKLLAEENNFEGVELTLGLFRMNARNTIEVAETLSKYGLDHIPEAHNYLKYRGEIMDCTKPDSSASDFIDDLLEETTISPGKITDYKVAYHKAYLGKWLKDNPEIRYSLEELWSIRELCIQDLATR